MLVTLQCHEFDKYGRLLGSLYPDNSAPKSTQTGGNSLSANKILIDEGFAYEYHGQKNWTF